MGSIVTDAWVPSAQEGPEAAELRMIQYVIPKCMYDGMANGVLRTT